MEVSSSRTVRQVTTSQVSGGGGSSSSASHAHSSAYRAPVSQGRQIVITRSAHGHGGNLATISMGGAMMGGGGAGFRESYKRTYALSAGASSAMAATGVNNIVQGRTKEKKDMQELNQRFASYIEKVRFLEAQNRKLAAELTGLRDRWGQETEKVKTMYEGELKQLRKLLDECERNKAELEVRITSMEDRIAEMQTLIEEAHEQESIDRETIEKLNQMINEYTGEIDLLRKRVARFDEDRSKDKREMERLRVEIERLRVDLDHETLAHINAENDCQTIREELEFQKQIHEAELKELASLAYRDTTSENRDFWKAELSQAIQDIQTEYDNKLDTIKTELETMYSVKVSEVKTTTTRGNMEITHVKEENARVKSQLTTLRERVPELETRNATLETQITELMHEVEEIRRDQELERATLTRELTETRTELAQVLDELQTLLDAKLSLELEIVAYRKLLEGEEARVSGAVYSSTSMSSSSAVGHAARTEMSMHSEIASRTQYGRTQKGNVSIREADANSVTIENTSARRQDISGWSLKREIDNGRQVITFKFSANTFLEADGPRKAITVWAKGKRPMGSSDFECDDLTWGAGSSVVTIIYNERGEERATHTARSVH